MIRLRIPRKDDASITRIIRKELLPYARESFPDLTVTRKEMAKRLRNAVVFVSAEPGRAASGFISLFVRERVLWVDMVALDRSKQGHGLGKKLLARAELFGRSRQCRTVQLYVDHQNEGAQRFYDRCDYTMQEYLPPIRCFRYEKRLGAL
ncbi:MAG: GNAT family N-acetyltransferase [Paenibacillaceae bacterium]|nr:GNAT family N-acetyltransferase [Paenibacillaceae bacterium]